MSMPNIEPEIKEAILAAKSTDPRRIASDLTAKFGRVVPSSVVVQVRGSMARAANVERAREKASLTLDRNLDIMGDVKNKLYDIFNDETVDLKLRLDVSKELRMWTKTETDTAGIEDAATNTVFVIEPAWSMLPEEKS